MSTKETKLRIIERAQRRRGGVVKVIRTGARLSFKSAGARRR